MKSVPLRNERMMSTETNHCNQKRRNNAPNTYIHIQKSQKLIIKPRKCGQPVSKSSTEMSTFYHQTLLQLHNRAIQLLTHK